MKGFKRDKTLKFRWISMTFKLYWGAKIMSVIDQNNV